MAFLDRTYHDNTVQEYLFAAAVALVVIFGVRLLRWIITKRLRTLAGRTTTRVDDKIIDVLGHTRLFFVSIVALYTGSLSLDVPARVRDLAPMFAIAAVLVQIGIWSTAAVRSWVRDYRATRMEAGETAGLGTVSVVSIISRMILWLVIALLVLDNFGVDVTALIAGLGIGGIAIALALQTVLSDIFASVAITLDKPFQVGDFIIVGDLLGTVENVGVKTTRVRSLSGEQLVFGNHDLLGSRIRNYQDMQERRISFRIGVVYQTPRAKVERIPALLREAVEDQERARFDRAHFHRYGDYALEFEIVYYVLAPDYDVYMDVQQGINFGIMRRFESEQIELAYPTQTLYVNRPAA